MGPMDSLPTCLRNAIKIELVSWGSFFQQRRFLSPRPSESLSKSHWLQPASGCERSAFLVEMLTDLSRKGNVIKDVRSPTESLGGLEERN